MMQTFIACILIAWLLARGGVVRRRAAGVWMAWGVATVLVTLSLLSELYRAGNGWMPTTTTGLLAGLSVVVMGAGTWIGVIADFGDRP